MSNIERRTVTLGKLPASEMVAVPLWFHMRALTSEGKMNGGLWSYTLKIHFSQDIIFCLVI